MSAKIKRYIFPAFYILITVLIVLYALYEQVTSHKGDSPLYINLMEEEGFIRQGFNSEQINKIPSAGSEWYQTDRLRVAYSPLPDLPKRSFFSFKKYAKEEFTIIIPVEFDNRAINFLKTNPTVIPGISLALIGENWEIYLNGTIVQSEIHKNNRTWWNVYFPFDKTLIVHGTNILAFKIIGDPSYPVTGLGYRTHHYIDDYRIIERRQKNYPLFALFCIFGFTGIYYLVLFLSLKNKREIYYFYFSIFSILLCIYTVTKHSIINLLIPNSDISVRFEYASLILLVSMFFLFIESLVRKNISRANIIYAGYIIFLALAIIIFNNSLGEDILKIWSYSNYIYCTYFIFYKLIYLYFKNKDGLRDSSSNTHIIVAIIGSLSFYICGFLEILELMVFRNYFSILHYSLIGVHIGMAFYLTQSFGGMYKKLEQANIKLREKLSALEKLSIGVLNFDLVSDRAFYDGKDLLLARKEFALLYLLARNEGKTLSVKFLYETVWKQEYDSTGDAALRVHVTNLKKKLSEAADKIFIETFRGEGYCFRIL